MCVTGVWCLNTLSLALEFVLEMSPESGCFLCAPDASPQSDFRPLLCVHSPRLLSFPPLPSNLFIIFLLKAEMSLWQHRRPITLPNNSICTVLSV